MGALFSFGGFGDGPSIDDRLDALEKEIDKRTRELIGTAIAVDDAEKLRDHSRIFRERFLKQYAFNKHRFIEAGDNGIKLLEKEPDKLLEEAQDYEKILKVFIGLDSEFNEDNFKQKVLAFELFRLGLVEQLTMEQEGYLLRAFIDPLQDCDLVVDVNRLQIVTAEYRDILEDTVDFLTKFRIDDQCCDVVRIPRVSPASAKDVIDRFQQDTSIFRSSDSTKREAFIALYKNEMRHDMTKFSYPIQSQLDFLDKFVGKTMSRCKAIQSDPDARFEFATDLPGAKAPSP